MRLDAVPDLVDRLKKRATIRRSITGRKSVQEGKPDRIADLLEEAAKALDELKLDYELLCDDYQQLLKDYDQL